MLGRRYDVSGVVEQGDRRGRTIGYPTVNLAIGGGKLLPPDGVYAAVVETRYGRFAAMLNQGHRPTFDDGRRLIEAHLAREHRSEALAAYRRCRKMLAVHFGVEPSPDTEALRQRISVS